MPVQNPHREQRQVDSDDDEEDEDQEEDEGDVDSDDEMLAGLDADPEVGGGRLLASRCGLLRSSPEPFAERRRIFVLMVYPERLLAAYEGALNPRREI